MKVSASGYPAQINRQALAMFQVGTPRDSALTVGKLAREIHVGDEKSRANRYKRLGIEFDETVIVE